jgi:hypothetical protein
MAPMPSGQATPSISSRCGTEGRRRYATGAPHLRSNRCNASTPSISRSSPPPVVGSCRRRMVSQTLSPGARRSPASRTRRRRPLAHGRALEGWRVTTSSSSWTMEGRTSWWHICGTGQWQCDRGRWSASVSRWDGAATLVTRPNRMCTFKSWITTTRSSLLECRCCSGITGSITVTERSTSCREDCRTPAPSSRQGPDRQAFSGPRCWLRVRCLTSGAFARRWPDRRGGAGRPGTIDATDARPGHRGSQTGNIAHTCLVSSVTYQPTSRANCRANRRPRPPAPIGRASAYSGRTVGS